MTVGRRELRSLCPPYKNRLTFGDRSPMSTRSLLPLVALFATPLALHAETPAFSLSDARTNKSVSLQDFAKNKAVAVVFLGTACPVSNAFLPTLADMHKEYAAKGIAFVGINSIGIDTTQEVGDHAKKGEIPFPVLKDIGAKVADVFGAKRTPEVFLLAADRAVVYRGRIDDQFAIDVSRMQPTKTELKDAIVAVLAGKPIAVAAAEASGCLITRPTKPKDDAKITYSKDIARILQKNCQECHRPGQIGPMPLLTYDDAAGWADMIREVVASKRMPPWYADPRVGHFRNDRSLPAADRETLLKWIDEGCAKGDDKDMPPPLKFSSDWRIGKPDVIFTMDKPYEVTSDMPRFGIPYQYFVIETNFKEDMWIEAAEARPGSPAVIHHIIAFIVPPRNTKDPFPPGPPLLPPIISESKKATILCGTAPGDMPLMLPPGFARRIPAGAKIVLQMHYTPNGKEYSDRSSIGLRFAKNTTDRQVL